MAETSQAEEFLELLAPFRDSLFRFAVRNVWDAEQAADVLQEAIMIGWSRFGQFERGSNFRAWMFKILVNTLYRLNRKTVRSRELRLEGESPSGPESGENPPWAGILENPQRLMESLDDRVVQALRNLGETERACFLLRLFEDFSYKEISEQLGVPMGTVMSHVFRARVKLRERLAELASEVGLSR